MSNKFTRNITGTKLKGKIKEPFTTNVQNDLLSDETDVYVRQERSKKIDDQYHCLTDNVKEVISNSDLISTVNFDHEKDGQEEKNKSYINVNKSNKTESEKMESNSHVMTPLQTGYSIEKNNRDVIPTLVKQHETPTEIESKSERIDIKKVRKNEFEVDFNDDDLVTKDYVDEKIDDIDIGDIDTSEFVKIIEENNRDVIPTLVKQHETPTEITSKSDELKVTKKGKNNFELELELVLNENGEFVITSDNEVIEVKKNEDNSFTLSINPDKFYTVGSSRNFTLLNNNLKEILGKNNIIGNEIKNVVNNIGQPINTSSFIDTLEIIEALGKIADRIIELERDIENIQRGG